MAEGGPIVVIGSINMDLVCRSDAIPTPGQTVMGKDFVTVPGGKGANQAVAAAKLWAGDVYMVGRVGGDDFGDRLLNGLRQHHVRTDFVTITEGITSGVATIIVDRKGENSIVVVPGANHALTPRDVDAAHELISSASAVILQLEIPLQTVKHAVAMCRKSGVFCILDPAPARPLPRALYDVDLLTPNQSEAQVLLELHKKRRTSDPKQTAAELLARGPRCVVLKLGHRGSLFAQKDRFIRGRVFKVKVVDTTAAGDAFTAALAVAHGEGWSPQDSLRFANAAGALTCASFGAQPALPARADVDRLLASA